MRDLKTSDEVRRSGGAGGALEAGGESGEVGGERRGVEDLEVDVEQTDVEGEHLGDVGAHLGDAPVGAARFLYEAEHSNLPWVSASTVPGGWAVFNSDPVVRRFMDPGEQVSHWSDFGEGGHFPAMEAGDLLTDDVRSFFRSLRP